MREPVTFIQRVVYSDAFDRFLGLAIMLVISTMAFVGVVKFTSMLMGDGRTQSHAEVSGTTPAVPDVTPGPRDTWTCPASTTLRCSCSATTDSR